MAELPDSSDNQIPYTLDLPIIPDDPAKSVSGRLLYLNAIGQYCDGFWESLRDRVLFPCAFYELQAGGMPFTEELTQTAQTCLDEWRGDYQVVDEWMIQTCHYTLQSWAVLAYEHGRAYLTENPLRPWFGPSEAALTLALAPFDPVFDQPFPLPVEPLSPHDQEVLGRSEPVGRRIYEAAVARESANTFKRRMRRQFEKQLAQYATQSKARILEQKHMRRDAAWSALYQGGQSPKDIEAWEAKISGEAFTHARILQAVNKFGRSIGLTLRRSKRGRTAKASSVSR